MPAETLQLTPVERLLLLLAIADFEALTPSELRRVANLATLAEHRAGATLSSSEDPRAAIHVVIHGLVEVRTNEGVERLGPRRVLGSLALALSGRQPPLAVAAAETLTLRLDAEHLEDLLEEEFGIFTAVLRSLTRSLLDRLPLAPVSQASASNSGAQGARRGELDLVARMLLMRQTLDFGVTRLEVLAELAQQAAAFSRKIGAPLWRAEQAADHFVVLASGSVHCAAGEQSTIVRAPVAIGMLESIAGVPRRFTAMAASEVHGLEIAGSLLIDLIEDYPNLGLDLLRAIARAL